MRGPAASVAVAIGALSVAAWTGCTVETEETPPGVLVVAQEQAASWIRNFNPLTTTSSARWPTTAGVYEPLFVFNSVKAEHVPWLAIEYAWSNDNRRLTMTTRDGVEWSDGEPFTADDVEFTFHLMKEHPALDRRGVWEFLDDVSAPDGRTVHFDFSKLFVPGFGEIAAQQIVPRHIWRDVEDPVGYPNENPVATGPFTEVRVFQNQVYELGKNPRYWQEGRPGFDALRFPAYPSNDRANLALVFDEVDWAGKFMPAIDRVYVDRDPEHHRYWFPLTGSTVFLYANTTRSPFDDKRVRQALSMAIDRELLVDVACYRYSRPADATGLSDAYAAWHDPSINDEASWVTFDVAAANALLDDAGLPLREDGKRVGPDGEPLEYKILTVSGWSDWVRACQVIAHGLSAIGIEASVRTHDFGAWFQNVQEGEFDLCIGWSFEGSTPYPFYVNLMGSQSLTPIGEAAGANWHRFASDDADAALREFERVSAPDEQRRLAVELQRIFAREAPAIPLYPNPSWAEYNVSRFTGFPSADNPYCDPSPNKMDRGEVLLVLTTINAR